MPERLLQTFLPCSLGGGGFSPRAKRLPFKNTAIPTPEVRSRAARGGGICFFPTRASSRQCAEFSFHQEAAILGLSGKSASSTTPITTSTPDPIKNPTRSLGI